MHVFLLCVFNMALALPIKDFPQKLDQGALKSFLKENNVQGIKKLGPQGYLSLREIMMNEQETVENRWASTLAIAKIGGAESLKDLEYAQKNKVWFMRSASLLARGLIDKDQGVAHAKQALHNDPALLVRATALQVLAQKNNLDRSFLWAELYNPINFKNGQSLSLRLSILKVLAQNAQKNEVAKFVALSREKDSQIQNIAQKTVSQNLVSQ